MYVSHRLCEASLRSLLPAHQGVSKHDSAARFFGVDSRGKAASLKLCLILFGGSSHRAWRTPERVNAYATAGRREPASLFQSNARGPPR
jgi:hypothetical protein